MSGTYYSITIGYIESFSPPRALTIPLTIDDQQDPRLLAILAWHKANLDARIAAEGLADPFILADRGGSAVG